MSSTAAISRRTVREALGTALTTALTSALQVYDYLYSKFEVESPVVRIINDGSQRPPIYAEGIRSEFYFALQFWVAYYEDGTPAAQQDAEDILDALEYQFTVWLGANQVNQPLWTMIRTNGRSTVRTAQVRGSYWIVETIPLTVEVYG
jgi:hypothetical protein